MLGLGQSLNFRSGPVQMPVGHRPPDSTTSSSSVTTSPSDHAHGRASRPNRERLSDLYGVKIGEEPLKEVMDLAHVYLTLGHYRNQLLHVFLLDSLVALTLEEEITCGELGGFSIFSREGVVLWKGGWSFQNRCGSFTFGFTFR